MEDFASTDAPNLKTTSHDFGVDPLVSGVRACFRREDFTLEVPWRIFWLKLFRVHPDGGALRDDACPCEGCAHPDILKDVTSLPCFGGQQGWVGTVAAMY